MTQALLNKSGENVSFIREDIERALFNMVDEMPQTRAAIALIVNGCGYLIKLTKNYEKFNWKFF